MGIGCRHGSSFLFERKTQDELPYSAERRRAMDCRILSRVRRQVLPLEPFIRYRLAPRSGADFGHSFCNRPDLTYMKGMQQARGRGIGNLATDQVLTNLFPALGKGDE
ncbi:unnamed protein product [Cuscuta epithymum]|uniref:Uncharacterized protein n=1 Tax=Cuscuta epithymum TaxID=186058 RepID=A0AAV0CPD6_9ASTE|nr:unnamed protein product [Cuscuta epithymum]